MRQTKIHFDAIIKRLNCGSEDFEIFPYVNFLSGLISNYHFDDGFKNTKIKLFCCPCSKTYSSWYEELNIDETICLSTKSLIFAKSISLIDHICAGATGVGSGFSGGVDLYHYLTICYIYVKHGEDAIGPKGLELISGIKKSTKKQKKKKNKKSNTTFIFNEHTNERRRSHRGSVRVSQRK